MCQHPVILVVGSVEILRYGCHDAVRRLVDIVFIASLRAQQSV